MPDNAGMTTDTHRMLGWTDDTCAAGEKAVAAEVATMEPKIARYSQTMMRKVREGKRDVYR